MSERTWSGGCQCGAVRYELSVRPDNSCICHCRMCQKQFGSFFGAFAGSHRDNFKVTRGKLAHFQSSDDADRGFCCDCGTPLTYEARSRPRVEVAIGSFDRHSDLMPEFQYGREAMEPANKDELKTYARWVQRELDATYDEEARHSVTVIYDANSGFIAIEPAKDKPSVRVLSANSEEVRALAHSREQLREKREQWVYFDRSLRIHQGKKTYLFKPIHRMNWTRTRAMLDAADVVVGMEDDA